MPTYTVGTGKTYSTITAALAAVPSNISGTGVHEIIVDAGIYNIGGVGINVSKTGASSSDYISIHAASDSGHNGDINSGVRITGAIFAGTTLVVSTGFTRISDIVISQTGGGQVSAFYINFGANNCLVRNVIFRNAQGLADSGQPSRGVLCDSTSNTFICCISIPINSTLGRVGFSALGNNNIFYNCGAYNLRVGFDATSPGTVETFINCWASATSCFAVVNAGSSSNNASSDTSAPGPNSLKSLTASNFGFIGASLDNYHITRYSSLFGAGLDKSSVFTTDIDNETISTWSIGPDANASLSYCVSDLYNYTASVSSAPWFISLGDSTFLNDHFKITWNDAIVRQAFNSNLGWGVTYTLNLNTAVPNTELFGYINYNSSIYTGGMPSFRLDASNNLILRGHKFTDSSSSTLSFGAWNGVSLGTVSTPTTPITVRFAYKSTSKELGIVAIMNGVSIASGWVSINTGITNYQTLVFAINSVFGSDTGTAERAGIYSFTWRSNLTDAEASNVYAGVGICGDLSPAVYQPTSSQPWQNNNEPHTKQTDAKPPALKTLAPEPVQGLGKPSKTKEAHNPTLQKQGPEQAPKANTSSFKTNEASASGLQAKKGYIHGFLSIMAETNGYPDSSSRLTGNMVYLLSDGLVTGKAYSNRDNVRPTRAVLQRVVLPVEPYGNFVHELRSNDSLALFQSHFQNRIGTTTGAGTTFYEFTPSKSRVNLGGSSFGTGSYVHGTKQAFCVSVFKAMNGTGYHFKSGVCDSLKFRFDPRDTVQVESDFRFATVSMLATSVGYPFGSFSTLPNFPGHKCDINFFGLPLTGFTFECNNNLVKTSPVGTNTRYYKFGQYQVSGVASVDIPPQLFQYYATMLADTSFPVYGTLLNSAKDKIVFQMDNCKIKPFEYNLSDSQIQIPFTAYESEDGSSPPIRIKVWTQNYSATTFQPN